MFNNSIVKVVAKVKPFRQNLNLSPSIPSERYSQIIRSSMLADKKNMIIASAGTGKTKARC